MAPCGMIPPCRFHQMHYDHQPQPSGCTTPEGVAMHVVIIGHEDNVLTVAEVIGQSVIKKDHPPTIEIARNIAAHMVTVYGAKRIIDRTR